MGRREFAQAYCQRVPHCAALGMTPGDEDADGSRLCLPYRPELLGDPARGLLSTGPIAALLDSVCGMAVLQALPEPVPIATLDLRIDYLRPAVVDMDLVSEAECYHITRHIAFARATVWQEAATRPLASCQAAFMHRAGERGNFMQGA